MNRIDGKFALITGGTQGLGAAIAQRLAENGAAGIITIGRSDEKGKEVAQKITKDTGCKTLFVKTDLPVVDQCRIRCYLKFFHNNQLNYCYLDLR